MHSAPLRKKSDALRSSARSGYLTRGRLRHAVSRPCDAICAVLEPSAVLRVVRHGPCCSHIRFCDKLIADALSPLPRECGASAHQLAAADAPCAASRADAFRIASTVELACATTLVLVRQREAASHHAVAASGPSGRRRRARGARLALHGPAWREGARAWTHQKSQGLTYENREFSAQMNPTPVYRGMSRQGPGRSPSI